jgi:cytochrome P450
MTTPAVDAKSGVRASDYNPLLPEVRADPYPYYEVLRRESPVHQIVPGAPFYCVSRYDDVDFVVRHPELFSSVVLRGPTRAGGVSLSPNADALADHRLFESPMLIGVDPPDHVRLRRLVSRAFTPRRIADLEPRLREIAAECVDEVARRGEMDLQRDLAIPLPVIVIAQLLGVEIDRIDDFKRWSDALAVGLGGLSQEWSAEGVRGAFDEMVDYIEQMMAERRARPQDDLISALVRAEEGEILSASEVIAFVTLLLVAGNETTTNLIGNTMRALLRHPGQLDQVTRNHALIPATIEEALRYDSPLQGLGRLAKREIELAGTTLPEGALVMVLFASANRDERQFADPDRFDVHRNPQGHLAFGQGVHFCLGASLARLESRVALETLFDRCREFRLAEDEITLVDSLFVRGPKRLRLHFERA